MRWETGGRHQRHEKRPQADIALMVRPMRWETWPPVDGKLGQGGSRWETWPPVDGKLGQAVGDLAPGRAVPQLVDDLFDHHELATD